MKYFFLALFFICVSYFNPLLAQEQLGLRLENYAGANSLAINPSWQTTNPLSWDLNIISVGQFVDNTYAYIANTNLRAILNNTDNIHAAFDDASPRDENSLILDFNTSDRRKFVSIFTKIDGPSLSFRLNDENYLGVFTSLRTAVSAQRIPKEFDYYKVLEFKFEEGIFIPKLSVAAMVWNEVGFNYARKIETYTGYISIGANVKFINAYEGGFFQNNSIFEFTPFEGDVISLDAPNVNFGYTNSNINVAENESFQRDRNGRGLGFDLGFTYIYEGDEHNYKLKIGASILDIGRVKFNRNSAGYTLDFGGIDSLSLRDYQDYDTPEEIIEQINMDIQERLAVEPIASSNSFTIGLPTALSLQADYMIMPMLYVNGLLIQRIPSANASVARGNLVAITPRFEHRWFSASLPVSLYNYEHFNVGAAVRLGYLVVGTDNLGSIFGNSNFTGTDIYLGLKFNPFDIGWNFGGFNFGGGGKNVKCYQF